MSKHPLIDSLSRKTVLLYLADILLVMASFLIFIWIKPASLHYYLPAYYQPFLVFMGIWMAASIPSRKYSYANKNTLYDFTVPVLLSNFIATGTVTLMMVGFNHFSYSRLIVFGTIALSTLLELILFSLYYYYRKLNRASEDNEGVQEYIAHLHETAVPGQELPSPANEQQFPIFTLRHYRTQIEEEVNEAAFAFMERHIDEQKNRTLVLSTTTRFNVEALPADAANALVNLKPVNDIKRINKFFETVNSRLPVGGLFIGCVITNEIRKARILRIWPPVLNHIAYFFYFLNFRVFPKIPLLNKVYFFLTNGYGRAVSKAEAFGRLYSCGFEVVAEEQVEEKLFFLARKLAEPAFDMNPTYGPLISLKRVGKNGKIIHVYKFRTMHPYSEYIQEYVFRQNQLQEGGKFKDDFRISTTGRIMRKLWIDELPMLFNLLVGDLKLVGVRPLSRHYFSLYSEELQQKRIRFRPGLIPPFYADMPETLEEIQASEMRYLEACEKHPRLTDIRYFFKAMNNILIKRKRSG
jgi:lipopolysaccharide/colanic/teichoic acid biosynthesis glycosyltransferase